MLTTLKRLALDARDEPAWEELYRRAWPFVIATMYRHLHLDQASVEDASQEVMFRLAKYLDFNGLTPASLFQYIKLVCTSVATDLRRGKGFNMKVLETPLHETLPVIDERPTPEELSALAGILRRVLEHLGPDERELAERLAQGDNVSEIAEILGVPKAKVYKRIAALRTRLRLMVDDFGR